MLRQEIADGLRQVADALKRAEVAQALRTILELERKVPSGGSVVFPPEILRSFRTFFLAAEKFTPAAKAVAKAFGVADLEAAEFWAQRLGADGSRSIMLTLRSTELAIQVMERLAKVLEPELVRDLAGDEVESRAESKILTLVLHEQADHLSRPQRVADALLSISSLYAAVASIEKLPENALSVAACDSGSDKSFDLLGAAQVVQGVKEILLGVWDRVVFHREAQAALRLELVASTLPVFEKVAELQKTQALEPEQAAKIRRDLSGGVERFLASGAAIPEMEARARVDPRLLLAPEPKLLTSGPHASAPEGSSPLTEEERTLLAYLQNKKLGGQDET